MLVIMNGGWCCWWMMLLVGFFELGMVKGLRLDGRSRSGGEGGGQADKSRPTDGRGARAREGRKGGKERAVGNRRGTNSKVNTAGNKKGKELERERKSPAVRGLSSGLELGGLCSLASGDDATRKYWTDASVIRHGTNSAPYHGVESIVHGATRYTFTVLDPP